MRTSLQRLCTLKVLMSCVDVAGWGASNSYIRRHSMRLMRTNSQRRLVEQSQRAMSIPRGRAWRMAVANERASGAAAGDAGALERRRCCAVRVQPPNRVISGMPALEGVGAGGVSRDISVEDEMPWTFSLKSSTFDTQRRASSSVT